MQQILSIWSTLTPRRRVIVIAATLAMFGAVLAMSRMASHPSMSLLYAGLEPAAAGDVVAVLDQTGVKYEVKEGAIFVEAAKRDALRMTLAAEGLPANNGQGYELLDQLSGFGTTSQMFDAAYWRAKEGELARTIAANPRIKGARVHISNPSSNPFQRAFKPTASVTVTTGSGPLSSGQARALRFLVASAVAGLAPEDVAVIDGRGGLVMSGDEDGQGASGSEDRAADLRRNIQRMLEARVGFGNAVVEVNVETVTEREAITEHRFDPNSRVAISTETEERSTNSRGTDSGAVSVASNLPSGNASAGDSSSSSDNSESRERINYEVSETTREVIRIPGAVKRISVAVLVDGISSVDPTTNTATWAPRPDAEIEALRELVSSAIGFDAERGDQISLKSMEFEPLVVEAPNAEASLLGGLHLDIMSLIQLAVLALVSLALGLFVVRPILADNRPAQGSAAMIASERPAVGTRAIGARRPDQTRDYSDGDSMTLGITTNGRSGGARETHIALTGEIDDGTAPLPNMAIVSGDRSGTGGRAAMPGAVGETGAEADPVARLRQLIESRREESVEILRSWMEDHEEQV